MTDHPCHYCGATPAPHGFRKHGPWSAQKVKGYLWACDAHRDQANERWEAAR